MKKIMFNDKYGLTQAVLGGRKTMTRRIVQDDVVERYSDPWDLMGNCARYHFGEVVAIAQRYCDFLHCADVQKGEEKGWNNKMFVKAEKMRHHIKITDIKVEQLQNISNEDCLKEGIFEWGDPFQEGRVDDFGFFGATRHYLTPKEAFAALIDKVSGKGTWSSNPWVFVYEFDLID